MRSSKCTAPVRSFREYLMFLAHALHSIFISIPAEIVTLLQLLGKLCYKSRITYKLVFQISQLPTGSNTLPDLNTGNKTQGTLGTFWDSRKYFLYTLYRPLIHLRRKPKRFASKNFKKSSPTFIFLLITYVSSIVNTSNVIL